MNPSGSGALTADAGVVSEGAGTRAGGAACRPAEPPGTAANVEPTVPAKTARNRIVERVPMGMPFMRGSRRTALPGRRRRAGKPVPKEISLARAILVPSRGFQKPALLVAVGIEL